MKHIHTFENFVTEAYKNIPYNVKIAGKYEITIDSKIETTSVAGFNATATSTFTVTSGTTSITLYAGLIA
jgi:hypothetical protein